MGSMEEPSPEASGNKPLGIRTIEYVKKSSISFKTYQAIVLILTFIACATYHTMRKTTSIVKSTLDPAPSQHNATLGFISTSKAGWAPFNRAGGSALLGSLDVAFLLCYSFGMYFAGNLGDRMDLRSFITIGMVGAGFFTSAFGLGYWLDIHSFSYFLIVQMLAGLFQSTGWPSVVAVMGNWVGKRKRGLIMGIWNAHTPVGNITGSLIASGLLKYGWGWSFVAPGILISFVGLIVFLILPVSPQQMGLVMEEEVKYHEKISYSIDEPLLESENGGKEKAVGFLEAWRIPGVAPFAACLFFSKLVAYTFLYWLPFYISGTAIDGKYFSNETAGNLSTMFDVGGVLGGILAGHISDRLNARAMTAAGFMYCAIPVLYLYRTYGHISLSLNIALMFLAGVLVNGPCALIATAVSADLGTHRSLRGNLRALATVTAIIDGTGSVGAALGPLLTGYISMVSWNGVFVMLMVAALTAGLLLTRLVIAEVSARLMSRDSRSVCHAQGVEYAA